MRVKRGVTGHAKHHKIKLQTKGMSHPHRRSSRLGRQAIVKSLQHAYRDRRNKKRTIRGLWNIRINAAAREHGVTYSRFIAALKTKGIILDRKILSELATNEPEAFKAVLDATN
jgi:large subunit ribosomal protein L20